jgi:hypothetical protein
MVDCDLGEKLFVIEEVLAEQEPHEHLYEETTHAKLRWFKDRRGEIIPSEYQFERAKRGEYALLLIDLFTGN